MKDRLFCPVVENVLDTKEGILPLDLSMKTKVTKNVVETMETSEDRSDDWKHVFLDSLEEEFSLSNVFHNIPLDLSVQKRDSPPTKLDNEKDNNSKYAMKEKNKATLRFEKELGQFNPDYDHDIDENSSESQEELSESESDKSYSALSGMLGPDDQQIWEEYKELTKKMKMETKMARQNLEEALMSEDPDHFSRPSPWEDLPW